MLEEIKIKSLKRNFDERGSFTELMRKDWKDLLEEDDLVQANLSITYPGTIRAWHRHLEGQIDYFICLNGAMKICAYDDETKELDEIISTGEDLKIVRIPGQFWHGFKAIGYKSMWLLYFVNRLYDYTNPDEERRPWSDQTIIPALINGKKDDPRVGKPWDWLAAPHK
jgi:dTDP-4-dehydrorhamnose 3,5-epimerase